MEFFVPNATNDVEADQIYAEIAQRNDVPPSHLRIWRISWKQDGADMLCEVGKPLPPYYENGSEPVFAIFDYDNFYCICSYKRGGYRGVPVFVLKNSECRVEYFS